MEEVGLTGGSPPGTDDSHDVLVPLGPDNEDNTADDGPNRDEPVLVDGVSLVEDLKVSTPDRNSSAASSKDMPCFSVFVRFLSWSQASSTDTRTSKVESVNDLPDLGDTVKSPDEGRSRPLAAERWLFRP